MEELSDEERHEILRMAEERKMLGITVEDCPEQLVAYKKYCVGALMGGIRRALLIATDASPSSPLGGDPDAIPIDPLDVASSSSSSSGEGGGSDTKGKSKGSSSDGGKAAAPPLSKSAQSYQYLVENGATALWNLHFPVFSGGHYLKVSDELVAALETCERALLLVQTKNLALYSSIANALANTLACRGREVEAEKICRRAMLICRPIQAKPLVLLRASMVAAEMVPAKPIPGAPSIEPVADNNSAPPTKGGNKKEETKQAAAAAPAATAAAKKGGGGPAGKDKGGDKSRPPSATPMRVDTDASSSSSSSSSSESDDKNKYEEVNKPNYDEKAAREVAKFSHFAALALLQEIKHIHRVDEYEAAEAAESQESFSTNTPISPAGGNGSSSNGSNSNSGASDKGNVGIIDPERRKQASTKLHEAVRIMDNDAKNAIKNKQKAGELAAWLVYQRSFLTGGGGTGLLEAATELPCLIVQARSCLTHEEDEEQLEMRTEIWALLAAEALQQKDARLAQVCVCMFYVCLCACVDCCVAKYYDNLLIY
jgi:hypothetical protein